MRVLPAGNSPSLQRALDLLRAYDPDLLLVDHAHTEGELFLAVRTHQPDVLLLDDTVRPDATALWFDYVATLSAQTRLIWIGKDLVALSTSNIRERYKK